MNFKIGDFVRIYDSYALETYISEVFEEEIISGRKILVEKNGYLLSAKFMTITLWEPEEGEYVWYYRGAYINEPKLVHYNHDVHGKHVEPFIGQLPKHLKELK